MRKRRAVVLAPLMPEFDRESGSRRVFQLIELLLAEGWEISFVARNPRGDRYARLLRQRGVAVYGGLDGATEDLMAYGRFELAVFAFWHLARGYMDTVRRLSPQTRIVIDTIDLHFLRNARRMFQSSDNGGDPLDAVYGSDMTSELNTYSQADAVITVSEKEAELVNDLLGGVGLARCVPDYEELSASRVRVRDRRGLLFLGNFRHPPNVDAIEFLCGEILPRLDEEVTAQHPVTIVGNGVDDAVRSCIGPARNVRLVGWVPSVIPYLEHARASIIPLRYGAGTKRKLIQSLMVGTPTVSTSAGVEGLDVRDGEHLLVVDDPDGFVTAVHRVVEEAALWRALSRQGRRRVVELHGRKSAAARLRAVLDEVGERAPKRPAEGKGGALPYSALVARLRERLEQLVPPGATVLVASRGDDELVRLRDRRGWHFPQSDDGTYAGHHPADSAAAIAQLEALRERGAGFLVFPDPSRWWLNHYRELRQHLERHYRVEVADELGVVYALTPRGDTSGKGEPAAEAFSPALLLPAGRAGEGKNA